MELIFILSPSALFDFDSWVSWSTQEPFINSGRSRWFVDFIKPLFHLFSSLNRSDTCAELCFRRIQFPVDGLDENIFISFLVARERFRLPFYKEFLRAFDFTKFASLLWLWKLFGSSSVFLLVFFILSAWCPIVIKEYISNSTQNRLILYLWDLVFFVVFVHCLWHLNACDYMVSMRSEHWRKKLSFTVVNVKII